MTTPERLRRRQIFESWLIAILCALLAGGTLIVWVDEAGDDESLEATIARNTRIGDCLTEYAAALTDALQDRDVVNKTARAAELETWAAINQWLGAEPPISDRTAMIEAITRFRKILRRLQHTEAINPYPDISACLAVESSLAYRLAYRLVSSYSAASCHGQAVTIHGSSGDDILRGTDSRDVIHGFRGDDIIHADKGNDVICGGRGGDTINGGKGWDRARGQRGSDFCVQVELPRSC